MSRDCEKVVRPKPPPADDDPPSDPPAGPSISDLRVCPASQIANDGSIPSCTTSSAGQTIARATRIYCTLRAINSSGAAIAIAFVFDGKEFYEQTTRDGGAFFAFYTYPETFPPGSWGCRAKLDGVVVSQVSFTTTR